MIRVIIHRLVSTLSDESKTNYEKYDSVNIGMVRVLHNIRRG